MAKKKRVMLDPFADIAAAQEKREQQLRQAATKPKVEPSANIDFSNNIFKSGGVSSLIPKAPEDVRPTEMYTPERAKLATEYTKNDPKHLTLNPYLPDEAAEMQKRKRDLSNVGYFGHDKDDSGLESFFKRLHNEQQSVRFMDDKPYDVSTGNKIADTAADFLGFGVGLIGPGAGAGSAVTSAGGAAMKTADYLLAPVAMRLGKPAAKLASGKIEGGLANLADKGIMGRSAGRAIHGTVAGGIYGTAEGISRGEDLPGIAKTAGSEALMFAAAEPVFGAAGDVLKPLAGDLAKYGSRYFNEPKAGDLLRWQDAPTKFIPRTKPILAPDPNTRANNLDFLAEVEPEAPKPEYAPWVRTGLIEQANADRAQQIKQALTQARNPFEGMGENQYVKPWPDYIHQRVTPDYVGDAFGNIRRGETQEALPAGPERLALPGSNPLQLTTHQMQALPARQRIPKQEIKETTPAGELWYVDPEGSARGNTAYLADVSKRYNELIRNEVNNMKGTVQGVLNLGDMDQGYYRVSLNPSWYRSFWDSFGRAPTEGEYRNMAIENLARGNSETGEPANDEFLSILSELSRGQKLPDEWHGLQKTIRELENSRGDYMPDNLQREEIIERQHARNKHDDYDVLDDYVEQHNDINSFLDSVSHLYYKKPYYALLLEEKMDIDNLAAEHWKGEGYYGNDSPDAFYGKDYEDALYRFGGGKDALDNDIDSLVAEMQTAQKQVEPYGLTRDLGRLNDIENGIRGKARMNVQGDYGQYEDVRFKRDGSQWHGTINKNPGRTLREPQERPDKDFLNSIDSEITRFSRKLNKFRQLKEMYPNEPDPELDAQISELDYQIGRLMKLRNWEKTYGGLTKEELYSIGFMDLPNIDWKNDLKIVERLRQERQSIEGLLNGERVTLGELDIAKFTARMQNIDKEINERMGRVERAQRPPEERSLSEPYRDYGKSGQMGAARQWAISDSDGDFLGTEPTQSNAGYEPPGEISQGVLFEKGQPKFKRDSAKQREEDFRFFQQAFSDPSWMDTGEYTIQHAPEALNNPEWAAANAMVKANSGKDIIPFTGTNEIAGAQSGNSIFLNKNMKQPVLYVAGHEVGHIIEVNDPAAHARMMQIVKEHTADAEGLAQHHRDLGYAEKDLGREAFSDAFGEAWLDPKFWARVRQEDPGLLKTIIDAIDRVIANVKARVSDSMTLDPYLKNIEEMRNRLADEYRGYLSGMKSRGAQESSAGMAAKVDNVLPDGKINPTMNNGLGERMNIKQPIMPADMKIYKEDPQKLIDDLVDIIGEDGDPNGKDTIALRGIYQPELGKTKLRPSYYSPDGIKKRKMSGTSGILVSGDWAYDSSATIKKYLEKAYRHIEWYGDTDYIAVIKGKLQKDEVFNDPGEVVLGDAEVIALIRRSNDKPPGSPDNPGKKTTQIEQNTLVESPEKNGAFSMQNPDIRYKAEPNTPADTIRSMIEYGASVIKKGGYEGFGKRLNSQYSDFMGRFTPEQQEQITREIWFCSKELNQTGATELRLGQNVVNVVKGESGANTGGIVGTPTGPGTPSQDWNHVTSKTDRIWPGIKQGAINLVNKTYRGTMDDIYRLDQLDNMQKKKTGKGFNADEKAYILALNARESGGTAKAILTDAMYDSRGNKIGDSLASVTKQIPKGAEQDFENYLVYRHAPSWLEQGRSVFPESEGITPEVSRQRAAAYEQAHPEFKQIADNLVKWQRDFGKTWLVDTGVIKPETWDMLQEMYPDYIPLQRKMAEIETGGGFGVKRGYANQAAPIKKAEGSQREIISPIESIIEQVEKTVKVARRNEVMQAIYRNIQQAPEEVKDWIEILPEKGETFESAYAKDGLEGFINWLDEPFDAMRDRKNVQYDRPNIVRAQINGETVHIKVNDQSLLDALTNLTPQGANGIIEGVRQVTRTMKVLTTGANVFFASRNIVRDLPMSYINSRTTNNPFRWAWDILDSMARVATGGKYDPGNFYQTYKALGGGSHSSSIAADRNLLAESKAKVMPGYYGLDKPFTSAGRGLKAGGRGIEAFTNAVETIPRLPEYIRTAKAGGDTYGARQAGLHAAQDVTVNFSRHGSIAKDADAFIPYLNASLQGMDKLVRSYGSNPVATVTKSIMAISVPTIGLYLLNRDDKNYKQLSSYVKDNYYCIPKGDGKFIKIAKPREAGVVFSSLVERCLNKWANDDPEGFRGFSEAWINNFTPPIRSIAAPFNDVRSNKNFADMPIVPGYMENLSPELQYDESTSAPAIAIGDAFNVSPKKIDYLARSYTGFLGEFGIPAASEGRGQNTGQRMGEVLKKTYIADPLYSNDVLSRFYEEKDKVDRSRSDAGYLGQEKPNSDKATMLNRAAKDIGELNKQSRGINRDKALSYAEKQKQTREIRKQMLDIAQRAMRGQYDQSDEWLYVNDNW